MGLIKLTVDAKTNVIISIENVEEGYCVDPGGDEFYLLTNNEEYKVGDLIDNQ